MRQLMTAALVGTALMVGMPQFAVADDSAASGGGIRSVRERVESSMVVRGNLSIETDGSVSALQLDKEEALPVGVVSMVRDAAMKWRFEPILREGAAVRALAPMSLRVVARKVDGDSYEISLRGINFARLDGEDDAENIARIEMKPPRYPEQAYRAGVSGSVYLLLKVDRDGKVADAFAEQVNLTVLSRESEQRWARDLLAKSALAASRRWTFRVPAQGPNAGQPFWVVRVPVSYALDRGAAEGQDAGRWVSYVPGPRERAPWRDDAEQIGFSPDALVDGSVNLVDNRGPHLLTPLQGG